MVRDSTIAQASGSMSSRASALVGAIITSTLTSTCGSGWARLGR